MLQERSGFHPSGGPELRGSDAAGILRIRGQEGLGGNDKNGPLASAVHLEDTLPTEDDVLEQEADEECGPLGLRRPDSALAEFLRYSCR